MFCIYCLTSCCCAEKFVSKRQALPIDTVFRIPVDVSNSWGPGKHNENGQILSTFLMCLFDLLIF